MVPFTLDEMKLYAMGASWGEFESLIMPANPLEPHGD